MFRRILTELERHGAAFEGVTEGLGWAFVGLANSVFVAALTSARSTGDRLLHHFADLGQFALLGLIAAILRALVILAAERLSKLWLRAALRLAVLTALGSWTARNDLTNFADRANLPDWLPASLLGGLVLAGVYSGVVFGAKRLLERLPRSSGFVLAVALVAGCNLVLSPDYLGPRVLVAAVAARLVAIELAGQKRLALSARRAFEFGSAVLVLSLLRVAARPGASTWQRVFEVPAAVASELVAPVLEPSQRLASTWIPPESAEWFRDRSRAAERAPSGAIRVPRDALVVCLTIDALRADVLLGGEHDAALPALAALRRRSVSFTNARSPSPSTLTTVMALLTSKYYSQTYWSGGGKRALPTRDESLRWTQLLSEHGVRTVHVLALHGLRAANGVGRGFETERSTRKDYGAARDVADIVIEEIEQMADNPGFVYAHFVDSHAPYTLGGTQGSPFDRYLAELALVDRAVGRVAKKLEQPALRERAVFIVSADHGEAFGEHGRNFHASSVYDELLRVPLLIALPGRGPAEIATPVSLIDIGPTLLDFYGLPTPGVFMGESLAPLIAGKSTKLTRPIVADSGRRIQAIVFADGAKAIRDLTRHTVEVYDLGRDPKELENRVGSGDFPAERYVAALEYFFDVHTLKRAGWKPPWRKF